MTLFDLADAQSMRVPTSCQRSGTCHECIVEVRSGADALCPPTEAESFLKDGYRLACQARLITEGAAVDFAPLSRRPKILTGSAETGVYRHGGVYGVAIDLGTTTVVLEVVHMESGEVVYQASFGNPQRFGGSDVMHRISYDGGPFRGELHKAAIAAVNRVLKDACRTLGMDRHEIQEMMVAGNSTMRDLFFGLDVQSIGQRPYKSLTEHEWREGKRPTTALSAPAHTLGLWMNPKGLVTSPPLIASHVGADTVADLVAIGIESRDDVVMLVDVGTNTEVVIGRAGRYVAASCPAGPAFEGGHVRYGMPGVDGAIESLRLNGEGWIHRTIGGVEPEGICGSGLIDLLAELRRHDRMTPKGVFPARAREIAIVPERGITFSREDGSNLAQAKAANYAGQFIAMRHFGVRPSGISRLYLAGGFANYVDVRNAIEIGFLAPVPEDRIVKVGNAAVEGARRLLCSRALRARAEELVKSVEHIELETTPDFFDVFVEGCQFKPMPQ